MGLIVIHTQTFQNLRQHTQHFGIKLMGLYLVLLLIPVSGIGLYTHFYIQRTLESSIVHNAMNVLSAQVYSAELMLNHIQDDISYLADYAQNEDSDLAVVDLLQYFSQTHPLYHEIVWIDDATPQLNSQSVGMQAWFETIDADEFQSYPLNEPRIVTFENTDISSVPILFVVEKMSSGVFVVQLDTLMLMRSLGASSSGYDWSLWIQPETILTTASNPTALQQISPARLQNEDGYFSQDDVFYVYHRIGTSNSWTVLQQLPPRDEWLDLGNYYVTFLVLLIGSLISVVGFALFAIARIIEPVYQLRDRVERLRRGETLTPSSSPVSNDEFGLLMTAFDQMAHELQESRKVERALVERLITAQEEERKMIAYDLHDGLIQQLVGARFYLQRCRQVCFQNKDIQQENVVYGYDVLSDAIHEGRRIIEGLHPTVLDDLGLETALIELMKSIAEKAEWVTQCDIAQLEAQPDRVTSVTLYRIAQEALNNIFKHAEAEHVMLRLSLEQQALVLVVQDDGCGFDTANVRKTDGNGWGLRTIRERTKILRGDCSLESIPQRGTTLRIAIPYLQAESFGGA